MKSIASKKTSASMSSLLFAVRFRFLGALCAMALVIYLVPQSLAQNPQDQAALARGQTVAGPQVSINGVQDGQVVASPNDTDLGVQQILKRREEYQPFTLSLSVPAYYTSNVALANSGEFGDLIVAPAVGAFYDPRITKTFFGHFGVREQLFYYADNDSFNFGAFDVEVGASYYLPQFYNLILRAWYDYNRLTMKDSFDAFFENHSLIFNAEVPFRFGRAQRVSIGTDANISLEGNPDGPRRHTFDAYLGYGVFITRAFSVDAVGRVVVRDYVVTDRVDVSGILSLTATYRFAKWGSLSAISSFATNRSNQSVFDYDVANIGGAVSFLVKF
jgi:hypothetical protein